MSRTLFVAFQPSECGPAAAVGQALGQPWDMLLLTGETPDDASASKVFEARWSVVPPADATAAAIADVGKGYTHVAAVSSMRCKDALPRACALLGGAMVTDAIAIESQGRFRRPIVAGTLIETVESSARPLFLAVRAASFSARAHGPSPVIERVSLPTESKAQVMGASAPSSGRPDLTQAKVVVSGGRPLKDAATFERLIGGLADTLGGAVGATRAAVDSGIAPNELQVGQTGKVVAPDLYIAAGISGSTQHMAGIKDSKVIVAINKDPQAPIFEFADVGIVADLFDVIPEMIEKLRR